jgi:ubiquinone biosynthesis monooxygenase Coq7
MIDTLIPEFDKALRAVFASAPTRRTMPGADLPEAELSDDRETPCCRPDAGQPLR